MIKLKESLKEPGEARNKEVSIVGRGRAFKRRERKAPFKFFRFGEPTLALKKGKKASFKKIKTLTFVLTQNIIGSSGDN
jgi:hypothetical protein